MTPFANPHVRCGPTGTVPTYERQDGTLCGVASASDCRPGELVRNVSVIGCPGEWFHWSQKSEPPLPPIHPPIYRTGFLDLFKNWYYFDAWTQNFRGEWTFDYSFGPALFTAGGAQNEYVDMIEGVAWNSTLRRRFRWEDRWVREI